MNEKETTESLHFGINRYDSYYDSINNKGNAYLTLNTFLLGGVLAAYYALPDNTDWWYKPSFILILLINCCVTFATLLALRPALSDNNGGSRFWFGDVSCISTEAYLRLWRQSEAEAINTDLIKQMHALACGLRKKFCWLNRATYLLKAQLVLIAIIGFVNLK